MKWDVTELLSICLVTLVLHATGGRAKDEKHKRHARHQQCAIYVTGYLHAMIKPPYSCALKLCLPRKEHQKYAHCPEQTPERLGKIDQLAPNTSAVRVAELQAGDVSDALRISRSWRKRARPYATSSSLDAPSSEEHEPVRLRPAPGVTSSVLGRRGVAAST
eukprot:6208388-Pleurochrysis_carterae.AAC.1